MNTARLAALMAGVALLVALTIYAGADAVLRSLAALRLQGLVAVTLLHLPVASLLGLAWWSAAPLPLRGFWRKFVWARFVRDAAGEVLPFSQVGGFVIGVRALHLDGVGAVRGALSISVDLVLELAAKLPYCLFGLVALFVSAPTARISQTIPLAVLLTAALAVPPLLFRRRLKPLLRRAAMGMAERWPAALPPDEIARAFDANLAPPRRLVACFALHTTCWFLGAGELWVLLRLMHIQAGLAEALALDSLVAGLRTFAFLIPGAAGIQEASYVVIGALVGLPPSAALALSLARRARELLLGVPVVAGWQWREAAPRVDYNR